MVRVSAELQQAVCDTYGQFFANLSRLPAEKCARDVLDERKARRNIELLCLSGGLDPSQLEGKRLLEVGCGFGVFLAVGIKEYGLDAVGIEPATEGFSSSYELARRLLEEYGLDSGSVHNGVGEALPFADGTFDLVYSSTVLEHTRNPQKVLLESLRVLKPGGFMVFVYPNYAGFFEGHYAIPWIPSMPRVLAKLWVRLWGRNPSFIDTLQFTSYRKTVRWMQRMPDARLISLGERIFEKRMNGEDKEWGQWAGLHRLQRAVVALQRLRISKPIAKILIKLGAFDPIILTIAKQQVPSQSGGAVG